MALVPKGLEVLTVRDYQRILFANVTTSFGWWLTYIGLFSTVAFETDLGAMGIASLTVVGIAPAIIAGPISGVLADRFDAKSIVTITEFLSAATVFGFLFAPSMIFYYVGLFLLGIFTEAFNSVRWVLVNEVIKEEKRLEANSLLSNTSTIARIAGPGIAGAILVVATADTLFLVDAVATTFSGLAVLTLSVTARDPDIGGSVFGDLLDGLRSIVHDRSILVVIVVGVVVYGGAGAYNAIIPLYVRDVLHFDASTFGMLTATTAAGAFVGSLATSRYGDNLDGFPAIIGGTGVVGLGIGTLALISSLFVVVPITAVMGLAFSVVGIYCVTLLQDRAPEGNVGRTIGTYHGTNKSGQLIAMMAAGVVTAQIGVRLFFGVVAVGLLIVAGVIAFASTDPEG